MIQMYDMKSMKAEEFISDEEIQATLRYVTAMAVKNAPPEEEDEVDE